MGYGRKDLKTIQIDNPDLTEVSSQLAQIAINVTSFGAKIDGVTDDSNVLQNIVDTFGDNPVKILIPKGIMRLTKTIRLKSNTTIVGSGQTKTVLTGMGDSDAYFTFNVGAGHTIKNVILEDFFIDDSNRVDSSSVNLIGNSDDCNVENVTINRIKIITSGKFQHPIGFSNDKGIVKHLRITNCHLVTNGIYTYGIHLRKPSEYTWIENNFVSLTSPEAFNNIAVYADAKYFHVNHNTCVLGGHSPIAVSTGSYGEISGNYVEGANYPDEGAIEVEWKDSHGGVYTSHHVTISGNIIRKANYGVLITSRGGEPALINNVIITGNSITDCNKGVYVRKSELIEITSNSFDNCVVGIDVAESKELISSNNLIQGGTGILCGVSVDAVKVNGNKINVTSDVSGIRFVNDISNVTVLNNDVTLPIGGIAKPIRFDMSVKNGIVTNNILKGGETGVSIECQSTTLCEKVTISNNTVLDYIKYGIFFSRVDGTSGKNKNLKIANNTFEGASNRSTDNNGVIWVTYATRLSINSNTMENNTGRSIYVTYSDFVDVTNNNCNGDYSLISGLTGGIRLGDTSNATVLGNVLKNQKYASILVTSNSTKVVVANNTINGSDDMGISLQGGSNNCLVIGNLLSNVLGANKLNNGGTNNELFNNMVIA